MQGMCSLMHARACSPTLGRAGRGRSLPCWTHPEGRTPPSFAHRAGAQLPGGQRRRRHTSPPRTRVLCALGLRSLRAPPALLSRDARLVLLGGLGATLVWFALSFLGTLPSVRAALRRFVWWRGAARAAPRLAPEARAALEREALRSTDSDEVPAAGAAPLPDGEDVEWFNMCWRKVWRVYQRGIESWLAEMLQPVLDGVVTDSPVPAMLKVWSFFGGGGVAWEGLRVEELIPAGDSVRGKAQPTGIL